MERQSVASSNVAAIGYDAEGQVLEVEFLSGAVYQYASVPGDIFYLFTVAPSKGQFLNHVIKGRFSYRRV